MSRVPFSDIVSRGHTPVQQVSSGKRNAVVSSQLMKLYSLSSSWAASHAAGHSVCTAEQSSGLVEDGSISVPHGLR